MVAKARPIANRLWRHVDRSDINGCWLWIGAMNPRTGYGIIQIGNRETGLAHRVSYAAHYGPIPDGMLVCHHCDNRLCVRPDHLFLGTYKDNYQDSKSKGRHTQGEMNGASKLTAEQVVEMRAKYPAQSLKQLSREYGVNPATVHTIIKRKIWKHV